MTVEQITSHITKVSHDIVVLKKDIATLKQLLAQSEQAQLIDDSYSLFYDIQNTINALDPCYGSEQINDKDVLSNRTTWIKTLQGELFEMENHGFRGTKAFWNVKACESALMQLEENLCVRENELKQLKRESLPDFNFSGLFPSWKKQSFFSTKSISPKTPAELVLARAANLREVHKIKYFQREPVLENIQSAELSSAALNTIQQYR